MRPFLFVTTAFLVGVFLFLCVGAWRIWRGRVQPRPLVERAAIAGIFAVVSWQALLWLRADQPVANQTRVIGVWVQLLSAFGISGVLIAHGWLVHRRINQK
jgi:cytochrome bd-type quinol oxidase subunit 1